MSEKFQCEIVEQKVRSIFITTPKGMLTFIPGKKDGPFPNTEQGRETAKARLKELLSALESDWANR